MVAALIPPLFALGLMLAGSSARAGDPVAGMALFNDVPDAVVSCSNASCHGPDPNDNIHGLQKAGNNPGVIENAIRMGVPPMMFLTGLLNPFQLDDIAAYLAPQPVLTAGALEFTTQPAGSASEPQAITLQNPGGVELVVASIAVTGAHASDFVVGGTCTPGAALASTTIDRPGGHCDVTVVFRPTASGMREAIVTLQYAGTATYPAQHAISVSGIGDVPLMAEASIGPNALDFGEVVVSDVSTPRSLTIANGGNAPLTIVELTLFGPAAGDYSIVGDCFATFPVTIAPGASCELHIQFRPSAIDVRNAALRIRYDATGSPAIISLSGAGIVAACAPPAPPGESQTIGCPAGQSGTIMQSRSFACVGGSWSAGSWVTTANTCHALLPPADLSLVEFVNTLLDHYFVTADPLERQNIETGGAGPGWIPTNASQPALGRVWRAPSDAAIVPVCRFYGNPAIGADGRRLGPNSHFYTASAAECASVKHDAGWIYEGVVFNVVLPVAGACAAPLVPVYRSYNGRFASNDSNHRYMTSPALVAQMTALGWSPEGIVFCIAPQ